eukprot:m51a1_g7731 putative probable atp-dependent rna helicase dhx58 (539) ;mRNA; r:162088-164044
MPQGKVLRGYQQRIAEQACDHNCIVLLPTGAGKTLVAAEVVRRLLLAARGSPLRPLRVAEYMGGMALPAAGAFDVLVATPKAFQSAQSRAPHLAWSSFAVVVFDEVHHVLKEHPYRRLALDIRRSSGGSAPRVLGLSASLSYAVGDRSVQADVCRLCDELRIVSLEVASDEELARSGYHGRRAEAEVAPVCVPAEDYEGAVQALLVPEDQRKPHLLIPTFFRRVAQGRTTPFASRLLRTIRALEADAALQVRGFRSPISCSGALREWGEYAHSLAQQSRRGAQLEHWYEALRLLVASWESAEDAATEFLRMNGLDAAPELLWTQGTVQVLRQFWQSARSSFARFEHLKDILSYKMDAIQPFRGIVFVTQRVMTHILAHVVSSDVELGRRVRAACLYATSSPATPSLSLNARQSAECLSAFATGGVNLLITTVVAEEGMDVPAANCVVRFDPMVNAVSLVQGRGRARQADSSFVVLSERADRDTSKLASIERHIEEFARSFVPAPPSDADIRRAEEAQRSRERGAVATLRGIDRRLPMA